MEKSQLLEDFMRAVMGYLWEMAVSGEKHKARAMPTERLVCGYMETPPGTPGNAWGKSIFQKVRKRCPKNSKFFIML